MRRLALALAAAVGFASPCVADEAAIFLPTALAARVAAGGGERASVAIEVRADGALVTVSDAVRALTAAPSWGALDPGRCGDPAALEVPAGFRPPEAARARATAGSPLAALESVVELVATRITLDENDRGLQDAASVLRRGRARCSGRANLAVGLLRAAGVPARTVLGVVVGERGARWHRWGEAWLGSLGWVPFDPGASIGLVSVRYLSLTGAGEGSSLAGVRLERINERAFAALPVRSGLRVLPADGVTLRCVAAGARQSITALLVGPDGSRWARRGRGEVTFDGMLPGRYRLVWRGAGSPTALDLRLGDEREVRVALAGGGEAGT